MEIFTTYNNGLDISPRIRAKNESSIRSDTGSNGSAIYNMRNSI